MLNSCAIPSLRHLNTSDPVEPLSLNCDLQSHPLSATPFPEPPTTTILPTLLSSLSPDRASISLPIMLKLKFEVPELTLFLSMACGLGGILPWKFRRAACKHSSAAS